MNDIEHIKEFIHREFLARPHFCFNDGELMYQHTLHVLRFAEQILSGSGSEFDCDSQVVKVWALLHDIGKTYQADEQTLDDIHEELGYEVSKELIQELSLTQTQKNLLKDMFLKSNASNEKKVVKEADKLAFLVDPLLQKVYKEWAERLGTPERFLKKPDNTFNRLTFTIGKKLGKPLLIETKKRWGLD